MRAIAASICAILASCGIAPSREGLPSSQPAFRSIVKGWIQPGDDLDAAKQTLKKHGFGWIDEPESELPEKGRSGQRLYATNGETPPFIGITRYRWWVVEVYHDGESVEKVKASVNTDITMDL